MVSSGLTSSLEIFVVDNDFKPIGIVPSSRVLRTPREKKMNSIIPKLFFLQASFI